MDLVDVCTHFLNLRPVDRLPAAQIPIEKLWERARPAQIESVATLVFSPEDLLLHVALDLAFADRFVGHARTLCDIGQTCGRYGDAIDWSQVIAAARAYQTVKPLYYALRWARELVGADVPSQALAELRGGFRQLPLEDRLMVTAGRQAILPDPIAAPIPSVARLAAHLLKHHRAKDSVTMAFRHLGRVYQRRLQRLASHPSLAGRSALASIFVQSGLPLPLCCRYTDLAWMMRFWRPWIAPSPCCSMETGIWLRRCRSKPRSMKNGTARPSRVFPMPVLIQGKLQLTSAH